MSRAAPVANRTPQYRALSSPDDTAPATTTWPHTTTGLIAPHPERNTTMYDSTSILTGNITRNPEYRLTTSGRGIASFGLAVNRRYQVNGEWQEQTSFFDVVAWAELGKQASDSLHKGDRVIVTGRMEQRTWETEDGAKRSKVEMVAADIGASVRFADVKISRISRAGQGPPPDVARAEAGVGVGVASGAPVDEEPF